MIKLYSFLIDKARVPARFELDGDAVQVEQPVFAASSSEPPPPEPSAAPPPKGSPTLPLIALARARSGDKGDHCNIGVLAREARFLPLIAAALSAAAVAAHMGHVLDPARGRVTRYALPGCHGFNFLLEHSLGGGGVASLRSDPQGKAFAQQLLAFEVPVPEALYRELGPGVKTEV